MAEQIDARGLSCPQPVMMTAAAITKGIFPISVLVDGMTAEENIRRFAESKKLKVTIEHDGGDTTLLIEKTA